MDLADVTQALREHAVEVVFINVLLEQLGLPVPAVPTLLVAGSLAMTAGQTGEILAAAVGASLIADLVWFRLGSVFGYRVLAGLCKLSINPASCVTQTEARFVRWGLGSLLIAKFIPGFSIVAAPVAGALRMSLRRFLLASAAGATLWAGVAIGAGWMLRGAVPNALALLDRHAARGVVLIASVFGLWLVWKLWRRHQFHRSSALPHITVDELFKAMAGDQPPLLLDLRGSVMRGEAPAIPGAVAADQERLHETVAGWPMDRPIVTLCACPEDAGAIKAARTLLDQGFSSVRPLSGGYEAWLKATL